jgi:ubiquinone/menaquinone biosynthesis C-methylase UbiE
MSHEETSDRRFDRLASMLRGYEVTQMLSVFATLGVPDRLARGPATAAELGDELGADADALHRLLRALTSVRVVAREGDGRFVLTPLGDRLRSDAANTLAPLAVAYGQPWWWATWGGLLHSVRTGEPAFDHVHGCSLDEYLDRHEGSSLVFGDCMSLRSDADDEMVLESFDFSTVRHLVDVGGGHGALVTAVLRRYPQLEATLFDAPAAIRAARERLRGSDVADRIELTEGDFFGSIPPGADAYVLKNILHNWDDEQASEILRLVRRASAPGGTLLVVQHVVPDDDGVSPARLLDVALLVFTGGRQRTEGEYRALFDSAGFRVARVSLTSSGISVFEARPTE